MRAARRISIACLSLLVWSFGASADEVSQREADLRFNEGLDLADKGRDEEARVKFAQAYALGASPSALFNLARTEQLSGHALEALRHWKEYARLPPSPKVTPAHLERAKQAIAELSKKVGHIAIEAPPSTRITVDGVLAGETPLAEPLDVSPGRHAVQARDHRVEVEAHAGETLTIRLLQTPMAPSAARPDESFWTTRNTAGVVLGGLALGAAAIGVGFVVGSNSADDNATRIRATLPDAAPCSGASSGACNDLAQALSARDSDARLARVFFVGAGAFALGSLATFVFWPRETSRSRTGFTPLLFPGGAGGRWSF